MQKSASVLDHGNMVNLVSWIFPYRKNHIVLAYFSHIFGRIFLMKSEHDIPMKKRSKYPDTIFSDIDGFSIPKIIILWQTKIANWKMSISFVDLHIKNGDFP